jgi:hypothetical protein
MKFWVIGSDIYGTELPGTNGPNGRLAKQEMRLYKNLLDNPVSFMIWNLQ